MAFLSTGLNNIAGSMGQTNLWIYNTADNAAAIEVASYFDDAVDFGLRTGDIICCLSSDETYWAKCTVTAGVVSLTAFVELT